MKSLQYTIRFLCIFTLGLLILPYSSDARCYGSSITFHTQSELDEFFGDLPDIDCFLGNVTIERGVSKTSAMSKVVRIDGTLTIKTEQGDYKGLGKLKQVGKMVFQNVSSVTEDVVFDNLSALNAFEIINCDKSLMQKLHFPALTDLTNLSLTNLNGVTSLDMPILVEVSSLEIHQVQARGDDRLFFPYLKEIGQLDIGNMTQLSFIDFPNLEKIGSGTNFRDINLAHEGKIEFKNLKSINSLALWSCSGLKSISLPQVTKMNFLSLSVVDDIYEIDIPNLSEPDGLDLSLSQIHTDTLMLNVSNPVGHNSLHLTYSEMNYLGFPSFQDMDVLKLVANSIKDYSVPKSTINVKGVLIERDSLKNIYKLTNSITTLLDAQFIRCYADSLHAGFNRVKEVPKLDLVGCSFHEVGLFDSLKWAGWVSINGCTNLSGLNAFDSVETLTLLKYENTSASFSGLFPSLRKAQDILIYNSGDGSPLTLFPKLKSLTRLNINNLNATELNGFDSLSSVVVLSLVNSSQLIRFNVLRNVEEMTSLNIENCIRLSDVASSKLIPQMKTILISNCLNLTDINFIKTQGHLQLLELRNLTIISSSSGLENIESIDHLEFKEIERLSDDFSLESLKEAQSVYMEDVGFRDTRKLMPALETVRFRMRFNSCPGLEYIHFDFNYTGPAIDLSIRDCHDLKTVGLNGPMNIKHLWIEESTILHGFTSNDIQYTKVEIKNNTLSALTNVLSFDSSSTIHTVDIFENKGLRSINQIEAIAKSGNRTFTISDNNQLEQIDLGEMEQISSLTISNHLKLKEVKGLDQMTFIGTCRLVRNDWLEILDFEKLKLVSFLYIDQNPNLKRIHLDHLENIDGYFSITDNTSLEAFHISDLMATCNAPMTFHLNPTMKSLTGGNRLKSYAHALTISDNYNLTTLDIFRTIDVERVRMVRIENCTDLNECTSDFLCQLNTLNPYALELSYNGELCDERKDIGHTCTYVRAPFHPSVTDSKLSSHQDIIEFKHMIIYDALGRRQQFERTAHSIDVSHFLPGVYVIRYEYLGLEWQQKFVKL